MNIIKQYLLVVSLEEKEYIDDLFVVWGENYYSEVGQYGNWVMKILLSMAVTERRGCVGTGLFGFHTLPAAKAYLGYMEKGSYLVTWRDVIGGVRFSDLRGLPFMGKLVHSYSRVGRKEVGFWMCCESNQIPPLLVSSAFHLWHLNALRSPHYLQ